VGAPLIQIFAVGAPAAAAESAMAHRARTARAKAVTRANIFIFMPFPPVIAKSPKIGQRRFYEVWRDKSQFIYCVNSKTAASAALRTCSIPINPAYGRKHTASHPFFQEPRSK
jgi:hypothetical protein